MPIIKCSPRPPYSLGLGIPFLATGLAFDRLTETLRWIKCHSAAIIISGLSAATLGIFGVLLAVKRFVWLTKACTTACRRSGSADW